MMSVDEEQGCAVKEQSYLHVFLCLAQNESTEHIQDPGQSPLGTCGTVARLPTSLRTVSCAGVGNLIPSDFS